MTTDMHAERVATALERIADALERPRTDRLPGLLDIAQRGLDRVAASFRLDRSPDDSRLAMQDLVMELRAALDAKPCDDRTCTDRDHWAPPKFNPGGRVGGDYVIPKVPLRGYERSFSVEEIRAFLSDKPVVVHGRISHGPEQCIHGQDRNDALECATPCAATMPGHQCTRSEHADDRHAWAMSDEEAQRILRTGQDMGFVAEADPLDEDDHRPRHFPDGAHLRRYACGHWHLATRDRCNDPHQGDSHTLAWWADSESLTFCDCEPDPEPDPLDESDHRPRHDRDGGHVYRHGPEHWHDYGLEDGRCDMEPAMDDPVRLADFPGPLTFCDCGAAAGIDGATD